MFWRQRGYLLPNLCKIIKPLTLKVTDSHSTPHSWIVYSWLIWIGSDNGDGAIISIPQYNISAPAPCCHSSLAMTSLWSVMKRLVISLIKYWYVYPHKSNFNQQTQTNANDGSVGPFTNQIMKWQKQKLGWYQIHINALQFLNPI